MLRDPPVSFLGTRSLSAFPSGWVARRARASARGMSVPWWRCRRVATAEAGGGASVKSVASGHWPGPAQARAWFATASMDGSTRVWRLTDPDPGGRIPAVLTCAATLDGHTAGVRAVAMPSPPRDRHRRAPKDPDARSPRPLVATASYDRSVRLWHGARDAPPFPPLEGHADYVFAAAFTPDGEWIVTGGADGRVCAWRASDADANANANANAAPPKPDDDAPPSKTDPYPRPSSRHARASPSLTVETGAGAVRSVAVAAAAEGGRG